MSLERFHFFWVNYVISNICLWRTEYLFIIYILLRCTKRPLSINTPAYIPRTLGSQELTLIIWLAILSLRWNTSITLIIITHRLWKLYLSSLLLPTYLHVNTITRLKKYRNRATIQQSRASKPIDTFISDNSINIFLQTSPALRLLRKKQRLCLQLTALLIGITFLI